MEQWEDMSHRPAMHDRDTSDDDSVLRPAPRQRRRLMPPSGTSSSSASSSGPSERVLALRARAHARSSEAAHGVYLSIAHVTIMTE